MKYSFKNDYSEGAHTRILESLMRTNLVQEPGYGEDSLSMEARDLLLRKFDGRDVDIHFTSGGTQTNLVSISSILRPYESVIAPASGHIAMHEAGAIESTGHKINTVDTADGKLRVQDIKAVVDAHDDEHMVTPRVVFVSDSTEVGSVYSKRELAELSAFCKANGLYLYLDGARLGSALTSAQNDLSLADIAELVDMFYIGGTKNGALLGEAVIISNDALKEDFRIHMKQKGALLAKGRVLGIQFLELFKDDLFFELARHANRMAMKLAEGIKNRGYEFLTEPVSNQIFPIFPDPLIEKLRENYGFYVWDKVGTERSAIRLVTSWATLEDAVDEFIVDLG